MVKIAVCLELMKIWSNC